MSPRSPAALIWFSLLIFHVRITAEPPGRVQFYKQLRDTYGSGYPLRESRTRSSIHCSLMCSRCAACHGCNYQPGESKCTFVAQSRRVERRHGASYVYKLLDPYTRDCEDIFESGATDDGVYNIMVNQTGSPRMVKVFCEFSDGNAWTVILKRVNDSLPFGTRNWTEYKTGFGQAGGSFYLGNDNLHDLTMNNEYNYTLRVDLTDSQGLSLYADYDHFSVKDEASKYMLSLGAYVNSSTLGDSFGRSNGMMFSTGDEDNDFSDGIHCAELNSAAWWYWSCSFCKLTAGYGPDYNSFRRISWDSWPTSNTYFIYAAMKLKRHSE